MGGPKLGIEDNNLLGSEEFDQRQLSIHSDERIDFYRNILSASLGYQKSDRRLVNRVY